MGLFDGFNAKPVNVNVTPSPNAINEAGKTLKKAVNTAQTIASTLNDVSRQLSDASAGLKKNAPVIANAAAEMAQDPRVVNAVAPVVGGANAALLRNMPRAVVSGGIRNAVNEAADQLTNLSKAATESARAVKKGLKDFAGGAKWVSQHAGDYTGALQEINNAVNYNANNALTGGANGINSMVGGNVIPNIKLRSNLGAAQTRAVASVAREVSREASRKAERKAERKADRKSRRKNGRKNVTRKNVSGGFLW